MKKILSVLLLAAMLVGCVMPSLVSAAGEPLSLTVKGPESVSATDKTVELAIELSGNDDSGVWGATFAVAYTKGWTVSSIENGGLWTADEFDFNSENIVADAYADFDTPEKIDANAYDVALIHVEKDSTTETVTGNGTVAKVVLAAPETLEGGEKLEVKLAYDAKDPMTIGPDGEPVDVAFNVAPYAAEVKGAPTASAAKVTAKPGENVKVDVTLSNFPEVKSMALNNLTYDTAVLELVSGEWKVENAALADWGTVAADCGAVTFNENTPVDGVVLTLEFKVIAESNASSDVTFEFVASTKAGEVETAVADIKTVAGSVTVNAVLRGDVDGNGVVDDNDAVQLLFHVMVDPDMYPVNQDPDMDGNDINDDNDAVQLLFHAMVDADMYPLAPEGPNQ